MNNLKPDVREILLVGNYLPDGQESMLRYGRMLAAGLQARNMVVSIIMPRAWFGRWGWRQGGWSKWAAYLNKYVIFPWVLRWRVRGLDRHAVVHIVDHSNAVYAPAAGSAGHAVVVTCHDLGAVRAALGEDTDCPVTRTGKILQAWIARSLGKADAVACVSKATQQDVKRLIKRPDGGPVRAKVVRSGLNAPYSVLAGEVAHTRLQAAGRSGFEPNAPFVLNVGSSLSRKNRDGVLRIFAQATGRWPEGRLVIAGEALTTEEKRLAETLGLSRKVVEFPGVSDGELEALYSAALCLLFPSKFEGFGWPALEAQACGCPVLASDAGALAEIVGEGGFIRPYTDEAGFAGEILRLAGDKNARQVWKVAGLRNVERFGTDTMIDEYSRLYDELNDTTTAEPARRREAA